MRAAADAGGAARGASARWTSAVLSALPRAQLAATFKYTLHFTLPVAKSAIFTMEAYFALVSMIRAAPARIHFAAAALVLRGAEKT